MVHIIEQIIQSSYPSEGLTIITRFDSPPPLYSPRDFGYTPPPEDLSPPPRSSVFNSSSQLSKIKMRNISPKQILEFYENVKKKLHIPYSLRDVRRFLNRAYEFVGYCVSDDIELNGLKPISGSDVALSFLLSGPAVNSDRMETFFFFFVVLFILK
jgi:hypothetical protein